MAYDFSLSNPELKAWFTSGTGPTPVREFIYLHEHPLVRPNFISEIEVLIHDAGLHIQARNISGAIVQRLVDAAEKFSGALKAYLLGRSDEAATGVVEALREVYKICTRVLSLK